MEYYSAGEDNIPAAGPSTGAGLILLYQEERHLSLRSIYCPIMILGASDA